MQRLEALVLCLSFLSVVSAQLPHVKCRRKHEKIGCFDRMTFIGANLLFSDHYLGGPKNKGYEVDWYNWDSYIHSLACRCNEDALLQGYSYFLLTYLGYCLGTRDSPKAGNRSSLACISKNFAQCSDSKSSECVGNDRTYYLYEVGRDGGYGEWGRFSSCTQTCDIGIKTRTRNCTNPAPTGHGRNCSFVGLAINYAPCNVIYCKDINECASNPCRNGGTCIDQLLSYICSCAGGYTGTHCEIEINECASNPCMNGGHCINGINQYTCNCLNGYTGTKCQIDINECASNPCMNGGHCVDGINKYTCNCPSGYIGTQCQLDINECVSNPCLNGGICIDRINHYTCSCAGGFTGTRCQIDINECASGPCMNGGICYNRINHYTCSCATGYTGTRCQININDCATNPCLNGGTCHDGVNSYTCTCPSTATGSRCQHALVQNFIACSDICVLFRCSPSSRIAARCRFNNRMTMCYQGSYAFICYNVHHSSLQCCDYYCL